MAERKKTPNILADLLGDKGENPTSKPTDFTQQAVLTAKQQNGVEASGSDNQTDGRNVPGESSEENEVNLLNKLKVTFYLSEESIDLLEDAQRRLRRMNRGAGKTQRKGATSKSALLEESLKLACADLESKGTESQLARILF